MHKYFCEPLQWFGYHIFQLHLFVGRVIFFSRITTATSMYPRYRKCGHIVSTLYIHRGHFYIRSTHHFRSFLIAFDKLNYNCTGVMVKTQQHWTPHSTLLNLFYIVLYCSLYIKNFVLLERVTREFGTTHSLKLFAVYLEHFYFQDEFSMSILK